MAIELSDTGEHLWLQVRKRGMNTETVARLLARAAGLPARAVGYAGMKDRQAVTTQWFSLHLPGREPPELASALPPQVEVLSARRHVRKLQRGALSGNRFKILLRECSGDRAQLERRVEEIAGAGVPNYFGEQRFGRNQDNLARAEEMFRGTVVSDRHLRGIYLSAARSALFNGVLARRVADGSWNRALDGEAFMLDGSNSFFVPEAVDDVIRLRLLECDIHPSGPLWGEGEPPSRGAARALETTVAQDQALFADGLGQAGMKQERRALRLVPRELTVQWLDNRTVKAVFSLPAGAYATTVLREIGRYHNPEAPEKSAGDAKPEPEFSG